MYKKIKFNEDARKKIISGVNMVSDAVVSTLGPRGTHVIYTDSGYPVITKDGVTVAQQVYLRDEFKNMGVLLAREAAEKTNRNAGDGTTSTVAILRSIVEEGNKYIAAGMNPILIKRGMDYSLDYILKAIDSVTKKIKTKDDKINIATISTNNDKELGEMIVEVIENVGKDGVVTVTTNNSFKTEVEYVTGTKLDSGFETPIFINDSKHLTSTMNNPAIIITSDNINQQQQLVPIIQKLLLDGKKDIVLFAQDIEGQALAFITQNFIQGKFTCIPVKLPSFGKYQKDIMNDFAKLVEATVVGKEEGRKITEAELSDIGTCDNIIVSRNSSIITGGKGDISKNIEEVKTAMEGEKDIFRIEKLKERLGKLNGKIANIKVGGASTTEQREIKDRIEDALNATKNAIETGVVEGAGTALLRCSYKLDIPEGNKEFNAGVAIVKLAMREPFRQIIKNGGENADAILGKVVDSELGYNSLNKEYEKLFESGIIDPRKVVDEEIINAIATAGILLTSSVAIIDEKEEK